ncbi:MAG: aldehyde dehydrogenase family protein, partial [Methylobacterium sp.]|nr:aldehyde dehydrogenase family protein [Methylobacterium sp.]
MRVFPNLIAGEATVTQAVMANINPSDTRDIIGEFAVGTRRDVEAAIAAAAEAFPLWSRTNALLRFEILDRIGAEISARSAEIGDMLAREEGKTLKEATAEVLRAGQLFKFFAAEAYRATSEGLPSVRDQIGLTVSREPIGVVGIITPWNFPIAIPAWKIAPALAYGNTVVFKPAELVPGSAWLLADIINRAGLPKGT